MIRCNESTFDSLIKLNLRIAPLSLKMPITPYSFRVDGVPDDLCEVIELIKEYSLVYAYVFEAGSKRDNPHMHSYIELSIHAQVFRKKVRALGFSGNKCYSLKEVDDCPDVYTLQYLYKEGGEVFSRGIPEEILLDAKKECARIAEEVKECKSKTKNVVSKIMSEIKKEHLQNINIYHREIKMSILRYYYNNEVTVRKFQLQSIFDTIKLRVLGPCPETVEYFFS